MPEQTIKAIYANGVFSPIDPVDLAEGTPVRVSPAEARSDWRSSLQKLRELRARTRDRLSSGPSTAEVLREDRDR